MRYLVIFLLTFSGFASIHAQKASQNVLKIQKILDANLYISTQGDTIQLAGLSVPSQFSKDPRKRKLAAQIKNFAKKTLKDSRIHLQPVDTTKTGRIFVVAYRQFMLQKECLNIEFLRRGYGKFLAHSAIKDSSAYLAAQMYARKHARGIWDITKYQTGAKNPFHYMRMSGGFFGIHFPESYHDDLVVPTISIGYHFGDLLKFMLGSEMHLTLAGQAYTFWNIFLPTLQVGPELYWKNSRLGAYWGGVYPVVISTFFGEYMHSQNLFSVEMGKRNYKSNGKWYEFIFTYYWFPERENIEILFKIELNFPLL